MSESGYYDVYVLARERSRAVIRSFHDRWLTGLTEATSDYDFPKFDDSRSAVYSSAWEVIDRLLLEPDQEYAIYWSRNPGPDEDLLSAHLFFTGDGGLIAGVTIGADRFADTAATLRELAVSVDARYGYAAGEEPPPFDTMSEFMARVRREEINLLPD
jgi:hypothetical protein